MKIKKLNNKQGEKELMFGMQKAVAKTAEFHMKKITHTRIYRMNLFHVYNRLYHDCGGDFVGK